MNNFGKKEAGYSVESLTRGIEQCRKNIKIFEDAIDKERDTMKEYRDMIDYIERKAEIPVIRVEINNDNQNGCNS